MAKSSHPGNPVKKPLQDPGSFKVRRGYGVIYRNNSRAPAEVWRPTFNVALGDLIYGPHGRHKVPACHHVVVKGIFAQTMRGEGTDLIISAVRGCSQPFQFTVHKNVIGLIPYFKSALAFRLSENRSNGIDVATLELPIDVDKVVFQEFLLFAYLRDEDRLSRLPLGILLPLLQMADY